MRAYRFFPTVWIPARCVKASHLVALFTALWLVCSASSSQAEPAKSTAYAKLISQAQADLDQDNVQRARERLEATQESSRGFEFDYLMARVNQERIEGAAADLITLVPTPAVQTRYGVLNSRNRQLVFICRDGSLHVRDLRRLAADPKVVTHAQGAAVWTGVFSDDGKSFFSGHQNGDVLVWNAESWELKHTMTVSDRPVRNLAAAPDGSAFVAEGAKTLEYWSLKDSEPKKVADVGQRLNFGEGLAFSPKGDLIATGGMFDVVLYSSETGEKLDAMQHASYTMGLTFSPDGKRIASAPRGNVNKFLGVFDVANKDLVFNVGPFPKYISGTAFSPDGKRIVATGCEKLLRVFDAATGEVVLSLPRPECGTLPAFTQDGHLLGWSEPDGFYFIDLNLNEGVAQP